MEHVVTDGCTVHLDLVTVLEQEVFFTVVMRYAEYYAND